MEVTMLRRSSIPVALLGLMLGATAAQAQHRAGRSMEPEAAMKQGGPMEGQRCGMMGMGRGMQRMGYDSASAAQMRAIHELVVNHDKITRTVANIPNGIRTVTQSNDARLAQLIREHVLTTTRQVTGGDDLGLPMESAALREIFRAGDKIHTVTQPTANGIILVQWSSDSAAVAALRQHAAEVSHLVDRGPVAMHEGMMKSRERMGCGRMRVP